jgi:hypothetical protein
MVTSSPPFDPVVEHAVYRLAVEFADAVAPAAVRTFVTQARVELCADPPAALPELVERLARVRIQEDTARLASHT